MTSKSSDTPDTSEQLLFECQIEDSTVLGNMHLDILNYEYPNFKYLNLKSKLYWIYNLQPLLKSILSSLRYRNACIIFIKDMLKFRIEND